MSMLAVGAVASIGLGVYGGVRQARAEKKVGRQTREAADINAALAEAEADQADLESRENIARTRREGRRFLGRQRAAVASSGVVGSTGSPLDAIIETAGAIELAAIDEARAARARKRQAYARADETRRTGNLQAAGLRAQSTGTLLSTAATTAGTAIQFREAGLFGKV